MGKSFREELKKWRGKQPQKAVHEIFGVPLVTYQSWEAKGSHNRQPSKLAMFEVRRRMDRWKF